MSSSEPVELKQSWDAETVILSYVIAVTGSFCTIQVMEQWRLQDSKQQKRLLLVLASVALGGCGIWAMHFTGMRALTISTPDGTELHVDFEIGTTILSLLFPVVGVFVGLEIASSDPFFLELEQSRRKAILTDQMKTLSISDMLNRHAMQRKIKFIALFFRPWRILLGGFWASLGVLGMHYLGMMAQRTQSAMRFDGGVVAASCVIAFVAATAAFWILFRALTFWPCVDSLRIGSALVMGIAVCGTHYTGMRAARYHYDPTALFDTDGATLIDGLAAFRAASNGSLVVCFWIVSLSVVRDLRVNTASPSNQTRGGQTSSGRHGDDGVRPFSLNSVPRNAVQPMVHQSGRTTPAQSASFGATRQREPGPALEEEENTLDLEHGWSVVPGKV